MDSQEREREKAKEQGQLCMCACMAVDLDAQHPSGTPPKHPPISCAGPGGAHQARHLSAPLCVFCSASRQQFWHHNST